MHNAELYGRVLRCNYAQPMKIKGGDKGFSHQPVWADADDWYERAEAEQVTSNARPRHFSWNSAVSAVYLSRRMHLQGCSLACKQIPCSVFAPKMCFWMITQAEISFRSITECRTSNVIHVDFPGISCCCCPHSLFALLVGLLCSFQVVTLECD